MGEYLPKTLENGRDKLLSEDDDILIKQFSYYKVLRSVKIKDGQSMSSPCIDVGGSIEIVGAMEVGK